MILINIHIIPIILNLKMIIRKPTKIELKLEDDLHEYEEFK